MRIKETTSKKGDTIYELSVGFNELRAIYDVIVDVDGRVPESIEIMQFKRRIRSMRKAIYPVVMARSLSTKGEK